MEWRFWRSRSTSPSSFPALWVASGKRDYRENTGALWGCENQSFTERGCRNRLESGMEDSDVGKNERRSTYRKADEWDPPFGRAKRVYEYGERGRSLCKSVLCPSALSDWWKLRLYCRCGRSPASKPWRSDHDSPCIAWKMDKRRNKRSESKR